MRQGFFVCRNVKIRKGLLFLFKDRNQPGTIKNLSMKKSVLLAAIFLCAACFSFQSCKKCATCEYSYIDDYGNSQVYSYPEECGNTTSIDSYKAACELAASLAGGSCTCTNK
jgi:hypothetical protein